MAWQAVSAAPRGHRPSSSIGILVAPFHAEAIEEAVELYVSVAQQRGAHPSPALEAAVRAVLSPYVSKEAMLVLDVANQRMWLRCI